MLKRLVTTSICIVLLLLRVSVFAGDVPEGLLSSDKAQVFFAEVISYHPNKENPDIEISPVKKIKGEIMEGTKQIYTDPVPCGTQIFPGNIYLFTYFDEHNPTYIFKTSSYDVNSLKIQGASGDMWERFEKYLNEGRFAEAEAERIKRVQKNTKMADDATTLAVLLGVNKKDAKSVTINHTVVDTDKFYSLAEKIRAYNIENVPLEKTEDGKNFVFPDGIEILVSSENEKTLGMLFVTDNGFLDRYSGLLSRLPVGDYMISGDDLGKIYVFLEKEGVIKLPQMTNPIYVTLIWGVVIALCAVLIYVINKKRKNN